MEKLKSLIQSAIDGALKMETLEREWANISGESILPEFLLEDLREGVQHTPGHLASGKIDLKVWHSMREYVVLVCDLQLVQAAGDSRSWQKFRDKVIDGLKDYSRASVEKRCKEVLSGN